MSRIPAKSRFPDDPLLTDEDMPPLSSLSAESDLRQFFNRGVSKALRQAASVSCVSGLPAYNVRDGLNEYDDDYTQFEPLGDTVTADMRFHAARKERERLAQLAEEENASKRRWMLILTTMPVASAGKRAQLTTMLPSEPTAGADTSEIGGKLDEASACATTADDRTSADTADACVREPRVCETRDRGSTTPM